MSKNSLLLYGFIAILIAMGWFVYQKVTDDTYKGMSIIPEQHEDIPLFEGLEPSEHHYIINGDQWTDIYEFYINKLPKQGWKVEYKDSALNDNDSDNDWSGFYSGWSKEGFEGELSLSAHYNKFEDQTEVMFDKRPILVSSSWIEDIPKVICIYKAESDNECIEIRDKDRIRGIVGFINTEAYNYKEDTLPRSKTTVIDFGNIKVKVLYEDKKTIYFQSEKGVKESKPDPGFFELLNIPQ
ncbi:hypothetical protein [Litchfieldia salsa]|uniref:Uncharacterized protein n=1 Tax=Litchfieldia salsa TaxID=930152 RepID=A0A1H0SNL7_9BACI|nr:hypothetical protein [Litchfieldia salsa]SDP43422.1 hypothetical protein SAMN05216565_10342 [Litchfieldia salsa]